MSEVDLGSCPSGEFTAVAPVNLLSSEAGESTSVNDDVGGETGCSRKTTEVILSMVQEAG